MGISVAFVPYVTKGASCCGVRPVAGGIGAGLCVQSGRPERAAARVTARAAAPVLIRLIRPRLRPYSSQIAAVVTLFAMQGLGILYLPRLNADLIDNGIASSKLWPSCGPTGSTGSRGCCPE